MHFGWTEQVRAPARPAGRTGLVNAHIHAGNVCRENRRRFAARGMPAGQGKSVPVFGDGQG
ncbi:hypothetical protein D3P04_21860 [Paracoccus onubensis]|uniref:Uncharacterized protein n=1 Tax=Paracoccus onubensis TaxID=1675788 RepID=A0A418SM06_9RHOB|nr:hypothetical protein D3P04_21860 [Paracoccus onubensis]